ncbi:nucleotidyltransferase family protein [Pseudoalteromonas sp. MMG010]|uniref:nucleotidyltransferase family protein n=1 Tax=Pseudoalteromonas sp. MMG010 TaxID=2822685 RepID=UPI001B3A6C66|nr:nucleotidyltransferase family protein [Pseudoalteromonas sp. MMG010]
MDEIVKQQPKLTIAILAAGKASRFGSAKQLAYFQEKTLLQRSIDLFNSINCELLVITGAHQQAVNRHLNAQSKEYSVVFNPDWQKGMSSSIKAALAHCAKDSAGIMFATVDQIHITTHDIQSVIDKWHKNVSQIVCAQYAQHQGIPAIFPRAYFSLLLNLQGDKGARQIIKSSSNVSTVALPNAEIDIDTLEQLDIEKQLTRAC